MVADRLIRMAYFLEDKGHEQFVPPLVERLALIVERLALIDAQQYGKMLSFQRVQVLAQSTERDSSYSRGNRIDKDFKRFLSSSQRIIAADMVILCRDANSEGPQNRKRQLNDMIEKHSLIKTIPIVFAIPDPYIEFWYLMDRTALSKTLGLQRIQTKISSTSRDKKYYKDKLREVCAEAGLESNGIELGKEIVACMNVNQVAKNQQTVRDLQNDLRNVLHALYQRIVTPPHDEEEQP
jgi:hypothetical protein